MYRVKDLIKELQKCNQDTWVFLPDEDVDGKTIIREDDFSENKAFRVIGVNENPSGHIDLIVRRY